VGGSCKKALGSAEICRYQHLVSIMIKAYRNLTWSQWELIVTYFPHSQSRWSSSDCSNVCRNERHSLHRQRCTWRALPGNFRSTVYGYSQARIARIKVHDKLYQWVRVAGREPSPSSGSDSQSIGRQQLWYAKKVGYDAGKKAPRTEATFGGVY